MNKGLYAPCFLRKILTCFASIESLKIGSTMFQEFKTFISRGNVIDLAVGIIIGAAFTSIVNSLVADLIMPLVGLVTGGIDFSNWFVNLKDETVYPTLKAAKDAGAATLNYGVFLNAVINFLIVGFAMFMVVKQVNRFHTKKDGTPAAPRDEVVLLTQIRDLLKSK